MPASPSYYWFRFRSALRWYLRARTVYDVHSPRFYAFIREVYRDGRHYHAFDLVAGVRRYWAGRNETVRLQSLGAPSKTTSRTERSASSLVATNAIAEREGQLLFRLALWLRAETIVEFGTNAGISTLYLHLADTRARLFTVEGNPEVAALAQRSFSLARVSDHLRPFTGRFDRWLRHEWPKVREDAGLVDLFFLDGDHRYQPTLDYVKALLPDAHVGTVFVIADIHWSEEMERAWAELQQLPAVTASLDLYHFGLLLFDPGMDGPHLTLAPLWMKPWRMGVF